jgi:hypothetical protein
VEQEMLAFQWISKNQKSLLNAGCPAVEGGTLFTDLHRVHENQAWAGLENKPRPKQSLFSISFGGRF